MDSFIFLLLVDDHYFFHDITLSYFIDDIKTFIDLAEYRVIAVEVFCVFTVIANKKLRSSRVAACVRHGQHALVVNLVWAGQFTFDGISWPTVAKAIGASALYHKVRNHPMKDKAIIEAFLRQVGKIFHGFGGILFEELDLHYSLFRMYFCDLH